MAKILIIDDSWVARIGLGKMLKNLGYDSNEVTSGVEAVEYLKTNTPDLVFLDLLMPDMDGLQVLEKLSANALKYPIVVVSADVQNTTKEKAMSLGAAGFLSKPPKELELVKVLKDFIK